MFRKSDGTGDKSFSNQVIVLSKPMNNGKVKSNCSSVVGTV